MKKWLTGFIVVLALSIIGSYVFIPAPAGLHQWKTVHCTADGAFRSLSDINKWSKWWSGEGFLIDSNAAQPLFRYKDCSYQMTKVLYDDIEIKITYPGGTIVTNLLISPLTKDSIRLNWSGPMAASRHPLQRWQQYHMSKSLESNTAAVLARLQSFLREDKNIYGMTVEREKVRDTILISVKRDFPNYPSTHDVYGLLHLLKDYISVEGAQETGYPMLHIAEGEGHVFSTMVAIPVNKILPGNSNGIVFKRMVAGNILVTQTQGGPAAIKKAREQLENYVRDYRFESPAIPFESLVTDRIDQKDSSKWITKLYYPVF